MLYYLCPRCQFKIQANKHVCSTCGYKMPATSASKDDDVQSNQSKANVWLKMLGLNAGDKNEPGHEKPALAD